MIFMHSSAWGSRCGGRIGLGMQAIIQKRGVSRCPRQLVLVRVAFINLSANTSLHGAINALCCWQVLMARVAWFSVPAPLPQKR